MQNFNLKAFIASLLIFTGIVSADLGGYVYQDNPGGVYGVKENGETGVNCAIVKITDTAGTTQEITPNDDGTWSSNLNAPARVELINNCDNIQESAYGANSHTNVQIVTQNSNNIQFALYNFKDSGLGDNAPIEVGSLVWKDENKNGIQDAGENGISGVEVKLYCYNTLVSTAVTDSNGNYIFSTDKAKTSTPSVRYDEAIFENLADTNPGNCQIVIEDQQALTNLEPTTAQVGNNNAIDSDGVYSAGKSTINIPTDLSVGENNHNLDIGFKDCHCDTVTIGNYVWNDTNRNGIQDAGESGISGVTVNLLDENGNVVQTTTTDNNGMYQFTGLQNGEKYYVEVVKPNSNYDYTQKGQGNDSSKDSNFNSNGKTDLITIGGNDDTIDCGLIDNGHPSTVCLGDYVWLDDNRNGIQDLGESGISGVRVNLLDTNGSVAQSTTTDNTGRYTFCGLNSGDNYYIQFTKPNASDSFTQQNQGNDDSKDSDVDNTGKTTLITVGSSDNLTIDCGIINNSHGGASISLTKKFTSIDDVNHNGIVGDAGDIIHYELVVTNIGQSALDNVTVTDNNADINNSNVGHLNTGESKTLTATHTITQNDVTVGKVINQAVATGVDSNGDTVTDKSDDPNDPTNDDPNNDGNPDDPTVVPLPHLDGTYCLGDTFWYDKNLNGIQDNNEQAIRNMIVELYDANKTKLATTKTNTQGKYKFCNLTKGTYYVKFILPSGGYLFTTKSKGSNGAIDSDANTQTGWSDAIVLENDRMDIDAGIYCSCDDIDANPDKHKHLKMPFSSYAAVILTLLLIRFSFKSNKIGE